MPFKKGPDYIDPAWHCLAAGCPSHNLDPFLMEGDQILASVARHAAQADALLIEGNRGLYDGLDAQGTYSTAELAKFLATPVVLVVDCTMRTRTTAAMVLGCQHFDPQVPIRGVILNQIARPRHEAIIRQAIETYCGIPVLGAIPRLKCEVFPERHMGLVPPQEHATAIRAITTARDLAQRYLDLDGLWQVAAQAPPLPEVPATPPSFCADCQSPVIGVIRDSAFQFYYPENLEALREAGAAVMELSALDDPVLPGPPGRPLYRRRLPRNPRPGPGREFELPQFRQGRSPGRFAHLCRMWRSHVSGRTYPGGERQISHGGRLPL